MKSKTLKKMKILKAGVGLGKLKELYNKIGLNFHKKALTLKSKHQKKLNSITKKLSYSGTLKIKVKRAINFYIKIRNYKGIRHMLHYPVRGQRTHTNAKTVKKLK